MREFKSNDEFYKSLDALVASLDKFGFEEAGRKISFLLHEVAWTTSSELFGELKILFQDLLKKHEDKFPQSISDDLRNYIQVIDGVRKKV